MNEFRFQWAKEERPRFYDGPDLPDTTIGTFDGSISYRFGRPFFLPVPSDDMRFQFTDNFTVISGNHTVKFGVDFNRVKVSQTFIGFARGRYIFADATIDGAIQGFQNYINGVNADALQLYLQFAPIGNRTVEEAGTQAYQRFRTRTLCSGQLAGQTESDVESRFPLGRTISARPDQRRRARRATDNF